MCNIDDAERFVRYTTARRKAIKPHRCHECRRDIQKGERYYFAKGLLPGYGWDQVKMCAHCEVGADWLVAECGGYCFQQVREEIHEHAQDYRRIDLWRLAAGMERKWLRFDGAGLMPVPKMPPVTDARHA